MHGTHSENEHGKEVKDQSGSSWTIIRKSEEILQLVELEQRVSCQ